MDNIRFMVGETNYSLKKGQTFNLKPRNCYQDTTSDNIRNIIKEIDNGKNWEEAVKEKFQKNNPWLCDIVTSPKRTKFIDEFIKPKNMSILDIGAGWGQFSLPLARLNKICALEPTPERIDFIKAAADQEKVSQNISFIGADHFDIKFENKFDLILSIGVLEWIGAYRTERDPEELQQEFLIKIKNELKEGGKLVIGIENRLGLKYLMGANDDHTGLPNISYLTQDLAKKKYLQKVSSELKCFTYSMSEYQKLLKKAGFNYMKFHVALPDYKVTQKIFPINDNFMECELNDFILKGGWINEHDGSNGEILLKQKELQSVYFSVAEMNLAHYFAPSFFIEAS